MAYFVIVVPVLLLVFHVTAEESSVVDVVPATTLVNNYIPFGCTGGAGFDNARSKTQFSGFTYKNIDAFEAKTGDYISFDLGAVNDVLICRTLYMAHPITELNSTVCLTKKFNVSIWTRISHLHCGSGKGNTIIGESSGFYYYLGFS